MAKKLNKETIAQLQAIMLNKIGNVVRGRAMDYCPKDTGYLSQHIDYSVDGNSVHIGTSVFYAQMTEFGTLKIRVGTPESPRTSWAALNERNETGQFMPWLRTSAFRSKEDIKQIIGETLVNGK